MYKILLVSSRAIALALDPLFFFVPVIHEDKKCISEDKKMWINAIFWRSVLDFIYLVHFVVKFYNEKKEDESNTTSAKGQRYLWMWFMFDILVILPIPQVIQKLTFSADILHSLIKSFYYFRAPDQMYSEHIHMEINCTKSNIIQPILFVRLDPLN